MKPKEDGTASISMSEYDQDLDIPMPSTVLDFLKILYDSRRIARLDGVKGPADDDDA